MKRLTKKVAKRLQKAVDSTRRQGRRGEKGGKSRWGRNYGVRVNARVIKE